MLQVKFWWIILFSKDLEIVEARNKKGTIVWVQ